MGAMLGSTPRTLLEGAGRLRHPHDRDLRGGDGRQGLLEPRGLLGGDFPAQLVRSSRDGARLAPFLRRAEVVAEHDVAGPLDGFGQQLIVLRMVSLGLGEDDVEGDDARTEVLQAVDQRGDVRPGPGPSPEGVDAPLVDGGDHHPVVDIPHPAKAETRVDGLEFDVLQEGDARGPESQRQDGAAKADLPAARAQPASHAFLSQRRGGHAPRDQP